MAENSKIEWTHHTFNPWQGCQKVGPGCDHCYAEARDMRFTGGSMWGPHAPRQRTSAANWRTPLKWNRDAAAAGERRRVFCASLADVFDNHPSIQPEWRADLWALIEATPNLDWMLLTKRPGNISGMLPSDWGVGWPNVWLGCTVVNQAEANRDIPKLLAVPAAVRFLSIEPLLGPVDLTALPYGYGPTYQDALRGKLWMPVGTPDWPIDHRATENGRTYVDLRGMIHLVIVGGESGPNARPMHPDWARSLRDQCQAAGVPFFFKQWGEWCPSSPEDAAGNPRSGWRCYAGHPYIPRASDLYPEAGAAFMERTGKSEAGRLLDGRTWDEMPSQEDR